MLLGGCRWEISLKKTTGTWYSILKKCLGKKSLLKGLGQCLRLHPPATSKIGVKVRPCDRLTSCSMVVQYTKLPSGTKCKTGSCLKKQCG